MSNESVSGGKKLLFSPKRQLELDIAKGLAVVMRDSRSCSK